MRLIKVIRTAKAVEYTIEKQGHQALEQNNVTAHEAPMPEFDNAFSGLAKTVRSICEFKDSTGIRAFRVDISTTKHNTRSAQIYFHKFLAATEADHPMKTPMFQFDVAQEGDKTPRQCTKVEGETIEAVIREALRYIEGERQQMLLPIDSKSEPQEGEPTPDSEDEE